MRFGSVCSGIEAASVAWEPLGWSAAWFSEIAPFPSKVLAHRFPQTPNMGSMVNLAAQLTGAHREIDLLVGGTPCQSFSVAGLRGGLADPRGNLALEFLRLADALRPRWLIWENVPGVLSSNRGRDFGAILGALGELGYGWAYRVLDARHFGVAQRRRRVFLVGHSGGGAGAAAVLFEPEGVRGDSAPRRKAREEAAGAAAPGPDGSRWLPSIASCLETTCNDYSRADGFNMVAFDPTKFTHPANRSTARGDSTGALAATARPPHIAYGVALRGREEGLAAELSDAAPALRSASGGASKAFVAYSIYPGKPPEAEVRAMEVDVAPALTRTAEARSTDRGLQIVAPCLDADMGKKWGNNQWAKQWEGVMNAQAGMGWRVRRLTPRECERLQGFPDDWTAIPGAADGPRYAALGNSMAVPVMRWIGERIQKVDALWTKQT